MAKLAKYTLSQDAKTKRWALKSDSTGQTVKSFASKAAATKRRGLGEGGEQVRYGQNQKAERQNPGRAHLSAEARSARL